MGSPRVVQLDVDRTSIRPSYPRGPAMTHQATIVPKGFRGDMANGFNPRDAAHLPSEDAAHVARRQKLLGPAYRLFYKSPVEISRAKGVFLYDKHGNEYLDAML